MRRWLRRIRGALGIGAIWGVLGGLLGIGGGVVALVLGAPLGLTVAVAAGVAAGGLVLGTAFAGVFAVTEGRRSFQELSWKRASIWGAVAGALFSASWLGLAAATGELQMPVFEVLGLTLVYAGIFAPVGALLASGTVWLARRDSRLLEAPHVPNQGELSEALGGEAQLESSTGGD